MVQAAASPPHAGPVLRVRVRERQGRLEPAFRIDGAVDAQALVVGRPVAEAVDILPRLFGLCRAAQDAALRLALGLPLPETAEDRIGAEILRDHLLKLCMIWPGLLGLPQRPPPAGWADNPGLAARHLFGPAGRMPGEMAGLAGWLGSGQGAAPVLAAIRDGFGPGEGASAVLPFPGKAADAGRCENSAAARQAAHPVLRAIAAEQGRGPFWRAAARLADASACLDGHPPRPRAIEPGAAEAPSSRGLYRLRASAEGGRVTMLIRRTPTDDMAAPGGALDTAIRSIPPARRDLLPLLVDIFDPCMAVRIEVVQDA